MAGEGAERRVAGQPSEFLSRWEPRRMARRWVRIGSGCVRANPQGGKRFTRGARTLQARAEFNTEFNTE
jgi:hypothetical protein